jgi:hypothetical protein
MVRVENHCCGCAVPGYPCKGASCELRRVRVYYCDRCGEEVGEDEFREDEEGVMLCDLCWDELFYKDDKED